MKKRNSKKSASGKASMPNPPAHVAARPSALQGQLISSSFKLELQNICGFSANFNKVHQHLELENSHLLILTETQVSEHFSPDPIPNYRLESSFKLHQGVCAYIHNSIAYIRFPQFELHGDGFDTLVLKICLPNVSFFTISLYRSPNKNNPNFFNQLTNVVDEVRAKSPNCEVIVTGDFNVHNKEWLKYSKTCDDNDNSGKRAEIFAAAQGLTQTVKTPTFTPRNGGENSFLLDLYLTSMPDITNVNVENASIGNSDHYLVSSSIQTDLLKASLPRPRKVFHFSKMRTQDFRDFLSGFPFDLHCFYTEDVNISARNFTETIQLGINKFVPFSILKPRQKYLFSLKAKKAIRNKRRLFNTWIHNKTTHNRKEYLKANAISNQIVDSEKEEIDRKKAAKLSSMSISDKSFYSAINSLNCGTKSSTPPIIDGDTIVNDPGRKANLFADRFASNSTVSDTPAEVPEIEPLGFEMKEIHFKPKIVQRLLRGINTNKASGPDNIPPIILKTFAKELAPILNKIFYRSYKSGTFPTCWKLANVQPVPKKGNKSDISNYRPIALLSVLSKIFEHYINNHVIKYLEDNHLISDSQYGFRKKRSTTDLLNYVAHKWNKILDQGGETYVVALDISKAFDRVWHANLINKLDAYGFHPKVLKLIQNFLTDRYISVSIDGFSSESKLINAGVPQGSVLSPTLFLIYIDELLKITSNPIESFADDSTLHKSFVPKQAKGKMHERINPPRRDAAINVNEDLLKVAEWGEKNLVNFNSTKTQLMIVSRLKTPFPDDISIEMNDQPIGKCENIRLLGVTISNDLLWNDHVMAMALSASRKLGLLNRCKKFFTPYQLLHIYKSYIRPCMEYCSQVWGAASDSILALLDSVQRRAIRIVGNRNLTANLDSLQHRRTVADLVVFYKYRHQRCSNEIRCIMPQTFTYPRPTRQATNANSQTVEILRCNTRRMQRDFFVRMAYIWNDLPETIITGDFNPQRFKRSVHHHLKAPVVVGLRS